MKHIFSKKVYLFSKNLEVLEKPRFFKRNIAFSRRKKLFRLSKKFFIFKKVLSFQKFISFKIARSKNKLFPINNCFCLNISIFLPRSKNEQKLYSHTPCLGSYKVVLSTSVKVVPALVVSPMPAYWNPISLNTASNGHAAFIYVTCAQSFDTGSPRSSLQAAFLAK